MIIIITYSDTLFTAAVIPACAGMTELKGVTGLNKLLYQRLNYPRYTKAPSSCPQSRKPIQYPSMFIKRSSENLKIRFSDDLSTIRFHLSILTRTNVANFGVPFCVKPW